MASYSKDKRGWRVTFYDASQVRKQFRIRATKEKQVQTICNHVEFIVASQRLGCPLEPTTASWLATVGVDLHEKLVRVGLAEPRRSIALGAFLEQYVSSRNDVKEATLKKWESARGHLLEFLGAERRLETVTEGDAEAFRRFLLGKNLAENTVRRYSGIAKQFFGEALKNRLITKNPFLGIAAAVVRNKQRFHFVSFIECEQVLDACPSTEWKVIFALARIGGLRCPSEIVLLKWADIDWANNAFVVHSPKTEHHDGKDMRRVPLFPELRTLLEAHKSSSEASEFVVGRYRNPTQNLRTRLLEILANAGIKPWPKLFQNLRSSRQTELCDSFPSHVVSEWMGNSVTVANRHYLQVTEEHLRRAVSEKTTESKDSVTVDDVVGVDDVVSTDDVLTADEVQVATQVATNTPEPAYSGPIWPSSTNEKSRVIRGSSHQFGFVHKSKMGDEGLEPPTSSL